MQDRFSECSVEIIPAIELAIENIIENGAEQNDSNQPTVTIKVEEKTPDILVRISDNGPGIPVHELEVLEEGEETDLKHGSGWIGARRLGEAKFQCINTI